MRCLLASVAFVLISGPSWAADITCSIPDLALARAIELCEVFRTELGIRQADWTNKVCADELLRKGFKRLHSIDVNLSEAQTARDTVATSEANFAIAFPISTTPASCGDGTLDVNMPIGGFPGEECDPPDGVTCDDTCQLF